MAEDFKVEIPISVKGIGAGAGDRSGVKKELEKLNKNTLKLNKTMFLNIDVIEILSSLLGDLYKVLRPLFKLLSVMLLLIFMPLMPIYKDLVKGLAKLASVIGKLTKPGGAEAFVQEKGVGTAAIVAGILLAVGTVLLLAVGGWIVALLGVIAAVIYVFWDDIGKALTTAWEEFFLPALMMIPNGLIGIWNDVILPAWEWFSNVPNWIWETIIKPSWEFLESVGSWIWNIISPPFEWLAGKISGIWEWFSNIGSRAKKMLSFQSGGVVPGPIGAPQLAVVHGGERIIPTGRSGGSVIININNPMVRQSSDIKAMANEVSRVLQRQMSGRLSSG